MTETYTKGIVLPIMRPVPLPIPQPVKWYNIWGGLKNLGARFKPRQWEIMEDYELKVPWHERPLCCPKGFIFDGASVPRVFWPIMSPTGTMFLAGLFHDVGYRYNCWFDINYNQRQIDAGKSFFDSQFEQIGTFVNDANVAPNIAWFGLVIGGWLSWNGRRKEGHDASVDFPPKINDEE
jgi:hypothetical protein